MSQPYDPTNNEPNLPNYDQPEPYQETKNNSLPHNTYSTDSATQSQDSATQSQNFNNDSYVAENSSSDPYSSSHSDSQYQGAYSASPQQNYYQQTNAAPLNIMALLGLIFAFVMPLIGLVLSIIGLKKANESTMEDKAGRIMSIIGLIVSGLSILVFIAYFLFIVIFVFAGYSSY